MGGSSDKAQKQATADEAQKNADIANTITGINAKFDDPSRTAQYDKLAADTTAKYTQDVNEQETKTARKLKFAQARSGQIGSSTQAYQGKMLGQDYAKAIIDASQRGQQASSQLRSADESTRSNLISMAQSGLDAGTAENRATGSLYNNLLNSQSQSTAQSLGDAFGDLGSVYQNSQDQKAARAGQLYGYQGLFSQPAGQTPQPVI